MTLRRRRRRRLTMSDLIGEERLLEKQPLTTPVRNDLERTSQITPVQHNIRDHGNREMQPQLSPNIELTYHNTHLNSRAQVSLFQTPTRQLSPNIEQIDNSVGNANPPSALDGEDLTGMLCYTVFVYLHLYYYYVYIHIE